MVDPAVRNRSLGGDGDDGRDDAKSETKSDSMPDSVPDSVPDSEPDAASEEQEHQQQLLHRQEQAVERGSLFDVPPAETPANPFGRLGPPLSRQSAFFRGFVGALGVLLAVLLVYAVRQTESVLELLLIAVFLAVGLNPIVEFAIRRGIKRGWAVLGVAVVVLGVITLIVMVVGPVLRDQITAFIDDAPKLISDLREHKSIAHLDNRYHFLAGLENKFKDPNFVTDYFGGVFNVGLSVLSAIADTVVVFILTLYFLAALPTLKRSLYSLTPSSRRQRVGELGDEILRRVGRYVIGAFLVALLAGTVSLLFLLSVGLAEYALPLALMVALLDLVPLVGSILGASIVSIVGLANSLPIGVAAIIFYVIYETLEAYVVYPRVMRSSVDVPEYVTIIAVLVGGAVGGIVGALLALPIGAAILLLVREVWVRRQDVS